MTDVLVRWLLFIGIVFTFGPLLGVSIKAMGYEAWVAAVAGGAFGIVVMTTLRQFTFVDESK